MEENEKKVSEELSEAENGSAEQAAASPDEAKEPEKTDKAKGTVSVKAFAIFCVLLAGLLVACLLLAFIEMNGRIRKISEQDSAKTSFETVSWTDFYNKYIDTVVVVTGTAIRYDSTGGYTKTATRGSGVVFSADGYIITNHHIIEDALDITVETYNGVTYTADLIGSDSKIDIAVLKIQAEGLHYAELASGEVPPVGTSVAIVGNPLGYKFSITQGCIGGVDRSVAIEGNEMTLMQLSAPINSGNSGGGVFNSDGKVVGIVNGKIVSTSVEGIGFAISAKDAMSAADDLMEYGYIRGRFTLGITMTTEFTSSTFKLGYPGCVMIIEVEEKGNAAKGGLKERDRLLSVKHGDDVKEITAMSDVSNLLKECSMGDVLTFTVYRNGETVVLDVVLDESLPAVNSSTNA
ncbi:MAG: trypsin-like peptidase domain-containing protein [Clostridia bacterium]|nr:trypsin-like peptidase domain-containing protein [Clostridia bacterium]